MKPHARLLSIAGIVTLALLQLLAMGTAKLPAADRQLAVPEGPFKPDDASLKQYKYPDWFRDAKLGIWAVWGPEAVPQQGDWYAHRLYDPKDSAYKYHLAHYGHPSKFGFKDIIPLWKAENWDPDRLMGLYQKAGAKYFCMIAEHHDNFDCWNSKHQKWNSVNMGPHRDIAGEWQKAARKLGLRFGMTEHLAASWWFYSVAKGADKTGPLAGVPYDGADPRYADLYWVGNEQPKEQYYCPHAPTTAKQIWFDRITDMIDRYHPDLLYSDSPLPYPDEFGRKLLAHYYNDSARRHAGRVEAVYNCKQNSQGKWVQDLERGVMEKICPTPWQTDTCVGGWYYDVNLAQRHGYKSTTTVIQMLCDIVSKNGNLLLNFPPRPDGTLDDDELKILAGMAAWMPVNGEAIFGTRPWKVYGEGARKIRSGLFNEDSLRYTAKDIRFTTKGPVLYAIAAGLARGWQAADSLAGGPRRPSDRRNALRPSAEARLVANRGGPCRHPAAEEAMRTRLRVQGPGPGFAARPGRRRQFDQADAILVHLSRRFARQSIVPEARHVCSRRQALCRIELESHWTEASQSFPGSAIADGERFAGWFVNVSCQLASVCVTDAGKESLPSEAEWLLWWGDNVFSRASYSHPVFVSSRCFDCRDGNPRVPTSRNGHCKPSEAVAPENQRILTPGAQGDCRRFPSPFSGSNRSECAARRSEWSNFPRVLDNDRRARYDQGLRMGTIPISCSH